MGKSSQSSGSKTNSSSGPSPQQTALADEQMGAVSPILQQLTKTIQDVFGGTTPANQIPIIRPAVEAGKVAASTSERQSGEEAARNGVSGPFLQALMALMKQAGGFNISQIAPNYLKAFINSAQDLALLRGSPAFAPVSSSFGKSSGSATGGGESSGLGSMFGGAANFGSAFPDLFGGMGGKAGATGAAGGAGALGGAVGGFGGAAGGAAAGGESIASLLPLLALA